MNVSGNIYQFSLMLITWCKTWNLTWLFILIAPTIHAIFRYFIIKQTTWNRKVVNQTRLLSCALLVKLSLFMEAFVFNFVLLGILCFVISNQSILVLSYCLDCVFCFCFLIYFCVFSVCGTRKLDLFEPNIQNGQKALPGKWPWIVQLIRDSRFVCTASLLNKHYVLTAAHCVE